MKREEKEEERRKKRERGKRGKGKKKEREEKEERKKKMKKERKQFKNQLFLNLIFDCCYFFGRGSSHVTEREREQRTVDYVLTFSRKRQKF